MTNYTITPINTGFTNTSKGQYLYHHSVHKFYDVEGFVKLPVTVFLVQGGGKKIMIDTGMSDTEIAGKYHHPGSVQPEGYAVYEQLENLGIKCSEITDIIFTHLHWDHVYYLDRFVNADLHVQRTEYQFAVNPIPLYYKSYEYPVLGLKPQFDGRSFKLYDGEAEIFDGISVYPTPGHSVGHQTVVVNTSEGQYHCCGDLIFTYDNLKPLAVDGVVVEEGNDLPDGDDGEHLDAVVLAQLVQGGALPGPPLHPVHGDKQGLDVHVSHVLEQLDGLPHGGAGGDYILNDGHVVAVLGLIAHHGAALAVVLGL